MLRNALYRLAGFIRPVFASPVYIRSFFSIRNFLLLVVAICIPISGVPLSLLLIVLGISAFLVLWNEEPGPSLTLLDVAIFIFALACCVSTVFAEYKPAAVNVSALCIAASLIYYCIRRELYRSAGLLAVAGLTVLFYAAAGLLHFAAVYKQWHALGFTRLVDFRVYVTSIPGLFPNSSPAAFFLSGLALSLVALHRPLPARNVSMWLFVFSSIGCFVCLLLSFSRGAYAALLCFAAVYAFFERRRQHALRVLAAAMCVFAVVALSSGDIRRAMLDTMAVRSTVSQRRSMSGRAEIALESAKLVLLKPVVGAGPGNFPYAWQTYSAYQQPRVVSESYNLLLNTAVESGILGVAALFLLGAGIAVRLYRLRRIQSFSGGAIAGAACTSLAVLSLSHSFLFSGRATTFCVYVLLAIFAGESDLNAEPKKQTEHKAIFVALICAAALCIPFLVDSENRNAELSALERFRRTRPASRNMAGIRTPFSTPDPYIAYVNQLGPILPAMPEQGLLRIYSGRRTLNREEVFAVQQALQRWRVVLDRMTSDDGAWENLSRLYFFTSQKERALEAAEKAYALRPGDYSHLVNLGLIRESLGMKDGAALSYARALEIYPRLVQSPFWRELNLRNQTWAHEIMSTAVRDQEGASAAARDVLEKERLGRLLTAGGDMDRAAQIIDSVLETSPELEGAWELKGELSPDPVSAVLCYKKAAFLDPADPLPHARLGELALARSDMPAAATEWLTAWMLDSSIRTQHSEMAKARYRLPNSIANDSVPGNWIYYISPSFGFSSAFTAIANSYEASGPVQNAKLYRNLALAAGRNMRQASDENDRNK